MSLKPYETLARDVGLYAPNCPDTTLVYLLKMTAIDFCQETLWLTHETDPIDVEEGVSDYLLDVPNGTEPVSVIAAWYMDQPLYPLGRSTRERWPSQRVDTRSQKPFGYSLSDTGTIRLAPMPDRTLAQSLVVKVALMPTYNSTGVSSDLTGYWTDTLINGTLARVYNIPNQPYTNYEQANKRELMYRQDVAKARIQANKALTTASLRVQPRQA